MNLPNKLTILRVVLVPVFMALLCIDSAGCRMAALGVFILASVTDWADGYIARKYNLISTFGKFMDPLADKILTTAAFLVFVSEGIISPWAVMLVLAREFAVAGIRLCAAAGGDVIAASFWGKLKTVSQMVAIIAAIILMHPAFEPHAAVLITNILVWISVVFTVLSGADYIWKNRKLFK